MLRINAEILINTARSYLDAECDRELFLKSWVPGWWEDKTAKEREDYTRVTERSDATYNTVLDMCRLIGIDSNYLLALTKSVVRFEKHGGKWDRYIHIEWCNNQILGYLDRNAEDGYYKSTGRSIAA